MSASRHDRFGALTDRLAERWRHELPAAIGQFVRVPSVSPAFDANWATRGAIDDALALVASWLATVAPDASIHRLSLPSRTPVLVCDIPGTTTAKPVLVYGHLDKQPAGEGWTRTDPFEPLLQNGLLYGRGGADDGFAPYLVGAVVAELRAADIPHPRVVLLLEASEESSSVDLPSYLDSYKQLLGDPAVVVCLDAFVPDHRRLWVAASMRGIIVADLSVAVLKRAGHSGVAGGVVPSSFRILRQLLDRVELASTGDVLISELSGRIPEPHRRLLERQAQLTEPPAASMALLAGVAPVHAEPLDQLVAQCWASSFAYVGIDGAPHVHEAGSVLRASTTVRLSIRLPPGSDPPSATAALRRALTSQPPYGAHVEFLPVAAEGGWIATVPTLIDPLLESASRSGYEAEIGWCAGAATIPFLSMFSSRYPKATILPIGVLGPGSNPHGPDECLDLDAARRLSVSLAKLLNELSGDTPIVF